MYVGRRNTARLKKKKQSKTKNFLKCWYHRILLTVLGGTALKNMVSAGPETWVTVGNNSKYVVQVLILHGELPLEWTTTYFVLMDFDHRYEWTPHILWSSLLPHFQIFLLCCWTFSVHDKCSDLNFSHQKHIPDIGTYVYKHTHLCTYLSACLLIYQSIHTQ